MTKKHGRVVILLACAAIGCMLSGCGSKENITQAMTKISELNYQEALELFDTAEAEGENEKLIARGRGIAYMGMTRYEEAEEWFLKALDCSDGIVEDMDYDINLYLAGVYTKQVREMNEAAKKSNAHFAMMFNQRTNCVYRKMKEIIEQGGIGDLQRVVWVITNWFRTQSYYDSGSWRATWAGEGGGVLINQCPHQLDLVQWVVGKLPSKVHGFCQYGKWHDIEVEDEVTAFFEYDNGATGMFITTTGELPGSNRFEVSGTKGKLVVDGDTNQLEWYKLTGDSQEFSKAVNGGFDQLSCEKIIVETDGENPQHKGIINNFINALLGKEEFFVDGTEGINGVELMNAIELSGWRNGAPVTLPVNEDEYLEELNKRIATSRLKKVDDNVVFNTAGTYGSK